jgi:hypothetical protein
MYHFRAVAQATGRPPVYGSDRTFVTLEAADSQPAFPIRGAFYYAWYPETSWSSPERLHTRYHPSLGYYDSSSPEVIRSHMRALDYGKVEVAISSWWGRDKRTDARLPALLSETSALGSPLRWSIYYEPESTGDPSVEQIRSDLVYLRDRYASNPAYFRVNGRFVVFVYGNAENCSMADRWKQANTVGAYAWCSSSSPATATARASPTAGTSTRRTRPPIRLTPLPSAPASGSGTSRFRSTRATSTASARA